ncbi:MAG: peptide chain release factor 3 [Acidimicrobiia bacterium]|nr:peptide chain release factor 3 [Acidimicrobiia bacterium]
MTASPVVTEAARRRTFAIISHPDAGKTTLTEKLLLYAGVIDVAGSVRARRGRRDSTSDWMELERQRGISISSTVLRFEHHGMVFNLLDTPGHEDFSEDTFRVLAATDAAVMVIDAAKGVESRTRTLYDVARRRALPVVTFVNKCDRPGLDAIEVLDHVEAELGVAATPLTWPVGIFGDLRGVVDRRTGCYHRYRRTPGGATVAGEEVLDPVAAAALEGEAWSRAIEEVALLDATGLHHDEERYRAGQATPTLFGSALDNFGVGMLLDSLATLVPSPGPPPTVDGPHRSLDAPFTGLVFKVQANMDPAHRDHVAFVRVCTGRFERGMTLRRSSNGRQVTTKYAHTVFGNERETLDVGYPGDVVGIVSPGGVRIGETLYDGPAVELPPIPAFRPGLFAHVRAHDVSRHKQLRSGLEQLAAEGVVQLFRAGPQGPLTVAGAVGSLQFEVATYRLLHEYGAGATFEPLGVRHAREVTPSSAERLAALRGVRVLIRADGAHMAVFDTDYSLQLVQREHPELLADHRIS